MPHNPAASAPAEDVAGDGITIEFAFSTNPAYDAAVALARRQPSYRQRGEGTQVRHRVDFTWQELESLRELKHAVWDLREKRAFVDGVELGWEHMAQITHCFQEKLTRGQRDHCFFDGNFFSPFGCRFTLTNLTDRIASEWLSFGKFTADGAFVFDKERIRARVTEQVKSSGLPHCPAYDGGFLEAMLEAFPERVHPGEDRRWRLMHTSSGGITGVVPVDVNSARAIVHELQEKVRTRRGPDAVDASGKRPLPEPYRAKVQPARKKQGLLARLFGD